MNYGNFGFGGLLMLPIILVLVLWPAWRICAKTGNSGALAILMIIPLVNILVWLYLAFSEWPIERELKQLKGTRGDN